MQIHIAGFEQLPNKIEKPLVVDLLAQRIYQDMMVQLIERVPILVLHSTTQTEHRRLKCPKR
jgi:hypothetical protein